jgi:hypothetical protein
MMSNLVETESREASTVDIGESETELDPSA